MNLLLPLGVAAVAAVVLSSSKAGAKQGGAPLPTSGPAPLPTGGPGQPKASELPGANASPSPQLVAQIDAAVKSANPQTMRILASTLDALGFQAQAADLRAAATEVERVLQTPAAPGVPVPQPSPQPAPAPLPQPVRPAPFPITSPGLPTGTPPPQALPAPLPALPVVLPPLPLPVPPVVQSPLPGGGVVQSPPAPADRGQVLAGAVALMIRNTSVRGKEDREMVRMFQIQEASKGVPVGNPDGLYGPKTALAIANLGIVPPKPMYWPNNATDAKNAQRSYNASLLGIALRDPVRAEEWKAAARVL